MLSEIIEGRFFGVFIRKLRFVKRKENEVKKEKVASHLLTGITLKTLVWTIGLREFVQNAPIWRWGGWVWEGVGGVKNIF